MTKTAMAAAGTAAETIEWASLSDVMLGNSFNKASHT